MSFSTYRSVHSLCFATGCTLSLVVSCKHWAYVVPIISTRVSGYSQVILLLVLWRKLSGQHEFYSLVFHHIMYHGIMKLWNIVAASFNLQSVHGLLGLIPIQKLLSHMPLCISMISGVCVQGTWNAQLKGQVTETHSLKVNGYWHSFVYLSVWHHNGATIVTSRPLVATIATTS